MTSHRFNQVIDTPHIVIAKVDLVVCNFLSQRQFAQLIFQSDASHMM